MKPRYYAAITLALAALSPANGGEVVAAGSAKVRPTHGQLAKRKSTGQEITRGAAHFVPVRPGSVEKKDRETSSGLVTRSTVLSYGGFWTIVPKGAVLHLPASYRSRVVSRPVGRLLNWQEFYSRNRGWIATQNVKLSDARGDTQLGPAVVDAYRRTGRIVVAVCHQGPISIKKAAAEGTKS